VAIHARLYCYLSGVTTLLIFYNDQTSLSNNGRVRGYPLALFLKNITYELQAKKEKHMLLAMIPINSNFFIIFLYFFLS
jgi:hypothetical protein